jgi:hypothetical protein
MERGDFEGAMARNGRGRAIEGVGETAFAFDGGTLLAAWHDGYAITVVNRADAPLETGIRVARLEVGPAFSSREAS